MAKTKADEQAKLARLNQLLAEAMIVAQGVPCRCEGDGNCVLTLVLDAWQRLHKDFPELSRKVQLE